jgi:LysR family transcriptional regulator, low CO2-responsive transcriptional regulator
MLLEAVDSADASHLMKPILDSRKLLAFVTLARCGSFTQTARELFLTQSAVSHAIKSLEDELQCRLFERLGRKAKLTQAGLSLLEYASRIIEDMQLARANLKAMEHQDNPQFSGPWQKVAGG